MSREFTKTGKTNKGPFEASVSANRQIGQLFYRLKLDFCDTAAEAFAAARPGQFAQLDLSRTILPVPEDIPDNLRDVARRNIVLRRPFSFCDIVCESEKTSVEILYKVVGPASLRMTTLSGGDLISIIGPLGNGFRIPDNKKRALLVIGGIGAGPLQHLAKVLTEEHSEEEVVAFVGARSAKELPFEGRLDDIAQSLGFSFREFAKYGINSIVATDDGSLGHKGPVTECFEQWLGRTRMVYEETIIYGCGPEEMLAELVRIASERGIDCQVNMERMMACGIGICQSCAVKCRTDDSNETVYKLCCEDGPVFDGREVVFNL
ncbi:MAG: dihydroorotate dehydrogenase electron transfer subunit [Sedimentisphaerales bacterium]|nr:dihydroorotate dehydrogenase electron transfer subunit [Sedimentisphaerales bacterium]